MTVWGRPASSSRWSHVVDVAHRVAKLEAAGKEIAAVLKENPSVVHQIRGLGTVTTVVILGEVGNVQRFPSKAHLASCTGTAPIDASSGDHVRHRLDHGGNRRLDLALHMAALA